LPSRPGSDADVHEEPSPKERVPKERPHDERPHKEHRYELVEIPESFGPRELTIDESRVKAHAFAQDDHCDWHFSASPFGGPVGHAGILANELVQIYFERYRIDVHGGGGSDGDGNDQRGAAWVQEAHVEETLRFRSPAFVGESVVVSGRFVDKYVTRGHGAVVLEGEARGADGRLLVEHRSIEYFRLDRPLADDPSRADLPMRRVLPEADASLAAVSRARAALAPGTPIPSLTKTISMSQLLVFSTLDHPTAVPSIHTDRTIAARAGLPAPLVQGQQLACHVSAAMTRFFGASWFTGGELRVKFLGKVCAGETVTVEGAVRAGRRQGGRELLDVDAWVSGPGGQIVAVAAVSCPLAPATTAR
jgi:acyl dehydratase